MVVSTPIHIEQRLQLTGAIKLIDLPLRRRGGIPSDETDDAPHQSALGDFRGASQEKKRKYKSELHVSPPGARKH
jgi:hypothetical protein